MKIINSKNYKINLSQEPNDQKTHTKKALSTLIFTGAELKKAIISTGMPDVYLTKAEKINRKDEILFKIKIFEMYVTVNTDDELQFNTSMKKYLDSSEVGAINYWIGMFVTTLIGQKKYNYDFMVHLSMLELFSNKIALKKIPYFTKARKIVFKQPDLIAINIKNESYGVFESKGYNSYSSQEMERAYSQVKSIKKINRQKPKDQLVVMTETGKKVFRTILKDPEGEETELTIDPNFLCLYHYLPIVELIQELNGKVVNDRVIATLEGSENSYEIILSKCLYDFVSSEIDALSKFMEEKEITDNQDILEYRMKKSIIEKAKMLPHLLIVE